MTDAVRAGLSPEILAIDRKIHRLGLLWQANIFSLPVTFAITSTLFVRRNFYQISLSSIGKYTEYFSRYALFVNLICLVIFEGYFGRLINFDNVFTFFHPVDPLYKNLYAKYMYRYKDNINFLLFMIQNWSLCHIAISLIGKNHLHFKNEEKQNILHCIAQKGTHTTHFGWYRTRLSNCDIFLGFADQFPQGFAKLLNEQDNEGNTPSHYEPYMVHTFRGVDATIRNHENKTAWEENFSIFSVLSSLSKDENFQLLPFLNAIGYETVIDNLNKHLSRNVYFGGGRKEDWTENIITVCEWLHQANQLDALSDEVCDKLISYIFSHQSYKYFPKLKEFFPNLRGYCFEEELKRICKNTNDKNCAVRRLFWIALKNTFPDLNWQEVTENLKSDPETKVGFQMLSQDGLFRQISQ